MSDGRERDNYPFWVAMGAAFVGTLLGGGAVWIGVGQRLDAMTSIEDPAIATLDDPSSTGPEPSTGTEGGGEPEIDALADPEQAIAGIGPTLDPGDSPLVRAIEQTRDGVVTLAVGGSVRGAGVVYDANGLLLTNYHVIEPFLRAQQVFGDEDTGTPLVARFADGRERAARILAADPDEDVAILSLVRDRDEERFAAVALGRSAELRLGEQVFAIGSPVGFEATVATGIVSSLQRTDVLANRQLAVIQLDAAINFGSSGGPLFNLAGELVGITTARSSRGEGIGFAIPIDRVRLFLRALYEGKQGRAGMIGVGLDVSAAIADQIAPLGYHSGIAVKSVEADGPAATAGMAIGDVIVAIRGRRHDELDATRSGRDEFARLVGDTTRALIPGETLEVEVVRADQVVELELTVAAASPAQQASIDSERMLGLRLDPTADDLRIVELARGTPIRSVPGANLLVGARIVSLFGRPVTDRAELGERLESLRSWAASGGQRSIAIGFELPDGQRLSASNFPLAD
jgi:S1-C subfamily serine protease